MKCAHYKGIERGYKEQEIISKVIVIVSKERRILTDKSSWNKKQKETARIPLLLIYKRTLRNVKRDSRQ